MSEANFDDLIASYAAARAATEPTLGKPPKAFVCGTCFGSGLTRFGTCDRCDGTGEVDPPPRLPIPVDRRPPPPPVKKPGPGRERIASVFESPAQRLYEHLCMGRSDSDILNAEPPPLPVPGPGRKRIG